MIFLKDEITKFSTSDKPTKELFKILNNKVNIFINLIGKKDEKNVDILYLPNKNQKKIIETNNYKLNELLFWYSFNEENLNKLLDPDTNERTYMELSMNLYKDSELDPIMTYINEKKLELSDDIENRNLSFKEKRKIMQMLRGLFIAKIKNCGIDLNELNNIVQVMNSRINYTEEIPDEEYYFSYMISDKYPKNLKIKMPIFEPMDAFYLFFKYDKGKHYKLGEIFKGTNTNFGGINDIAQNILKKDDYENMAKLSEDMGKLFYENICSKEYKNENNLDIIEFLNEESEKETSNNKKELLNRLSSCFIFMKHFYEKVINNQKENPKNYEFKLDDFYNLLNDKNKLLNCSNIFKKEKEFKDKKENEDICLIPPSFIYFINNNQTFINELFTNLNNSDKSIITDLNKKRKIDYLPFWLYILRNISSLNCLEYSKKEIEPKIAETIVDRIKKKISYCLNNKKPLNLSWLNLLLDNISSEILDPKIHLFYDFFNSLINNLNVTSKNLKNFTKDQLEKYFCEIIDSVFDQKLNEILDKNINENKDNIILQFTKDPSHYLYEKIYLNVNNKFNDVMENDKIYELIENFNKNIIIYSKNFEEKIKEANDKLFNKEYEKLMDSHSKKIKDQFSSLCKNNSNNITSIDKIISKKEFGEFTNKQISKDEINNLEKIHNELSRYKKYGLKIGNEEESLIYYEIKYNFTKLAKNQYSLYYKNKLIDLPNEVIKGVFYIISANQDGFKDDFKIKVIKEKNKEEDKKKAEKKPKDNEGDDKEKEEEEKEDDEKEEDDNIYEDYPLEDCIDFNTAKRNCFSKYIIENEEEIKKSISNDLKIPVKEDVKNPPEILLSGSKVKDFSNYMEKLIESSNNLFSIFKEIKEKTINKKEIIKKFEEEIGNLLGKLKKIKSMLKLDDNDFDDLINSSKDLDKEISDFLSNLSKYYGNYTISVKNLLNEFFSIKENNLFSLDFTLPSIPESLAQSFIHLDKMKEDSENLCVPIINIDSEGKNLICCYKSLELNLGKICPAFYHKPFIINIISFVNEDMTITIKSYKEKKIENEKKKEKKKEEKEEEKKEKNEEKEEEDKKEKEEKKEIPIIMYEGDEINNRYLNVKESVKKGENIQLYVDIPQTFEEDTIQMCSILELESISGKKLELNVNIILTTIPISVLISCKEYKLIKEKINYDNNITFEQCFKLDTNQFIGDEEINFELVNYKNNDSIDFYLNVRSLENNSSNKPIFSQKKLKNEFSIIIPKYDCDSTDKDVPRLNCILEVFINKNFVIYILIDALIRPNINIFKMYDFYSKEYVENEITIYLNDRTQEIFKKEKRCIELSCILFSTLDNIEFKVTPSKFYGGIIQPCKGNIENEKCEFKLFLQFREDSNIYFPSYCNIDIFINMKKLSFKIKFSSPMNAIFSDDYYKHFGIKGKNNLDENWRLITEPSGEYKYYVTPFECSENEINLKDLETITSEIDGLQFYDINNHGNIYLSSTYSKIHKKHYFSANELKVSFAVIYKGQWYPLIKNNGNIKYNVIYFEDWKEIKQQVIDDFPKWERKIKTISNAYSEISKSYFYHQYYKPDSFYWDCERILRDNLNKGIVEFKELIKSFKNNAENEKISFEGLAYHILFNTNNILFELHKIFPNDIQEELRRDFFYYRNSSKDEDKDLALYNYILRLRKIFDNKESELKKNNKKIKINLPNIIEEQKRLLFSYYSLNNIFFDKPKIIINFEKQFQSFNKDKDFLELIISE